MVLPKEGSIMLYQFKGQRGVSMVALMVAIVVLLAAAAGGYILMKGKTNVSQTGTTEVAQQASPTTGAPGTGDSSDSGLDKDTTNINTQMSALNSDSVNIDQSLSTTPESLQ